MHAGRLLTIVVLTLFTVSTALDAALEWAPDASSSSDGPSHDRSGSGNLPCAGLCACHAGCVKIDAPNAIPIADAPAARPAVALPSAPESRAAEVIPPPPKP